MKYSRHVVAGSVLIVVALVLMVVNKPDRDEMSQGAPGSTTAGSNSAALPQQETRYPRPERTRGQAESPDAIQLKLLWARGRGRELLVALDQLSERAEKDDWRAVASVLEEQAASDGRYETASYLLATGHGAPNGIRLAIYSAALDNPDEEVRDTARLELINLTGERFTSRAEANAWIASNPEASRDEEEDFPEE